LQVIARGIFFCFLFWFGRFFFSYPIVLASTRSLCSPSLCFPGSQPFSRVHPPTFSSGFSFAPSFLSEHRLGLTNVFFSFKDVLNHPLFFSLLLLAQPYPCTFSLTMVPGFFFFVFLCFVSVCPLFDGLTCRTPPLHHKIRFSNSLVHSPLAVFPPNHHRPFLFGFWTLVTPF